MTDYKELITALREEAEAVKAVEWEIPICTENHIREAADAIEQLVKERDAAMEDIPRLCWSCKSNENKLKCYKCNRLLEYRPAWEWRGVKEAEYEID